jgi:hypothetical protein
MSAERWKDGEWAGLPSKGQLVDMGTCPVEGRLPLVRAQYLQDVHTSHCLD